MPVSKRILWLALGLVVGVTGVTHAQETRSEEAFFSNFLRDYKDPVTILSAVADRANETITLRGRGFGRRTPSLMFESLPLTVLSATDTQVIAYLPATVPDGTYLFTVVRPQPRQDADRGHFYVAVVTPKEVSGEKGENGEKGESGDPGPVGPQGDAGLAGPPGQAGPAGERGPQGETGAPGAPGSAGAAGAQGLIGAQGDAGAPGSPGLQGPSGPQGPAGAAGAAGMPGIPGAPGPKGDAGVSGYEIVSVAAPVSPAGVNSGGQVSGVAVCPAGKRAIAGGFEALYSQMSAASGLVASASFPLSEASWKVTMRNASGFAVSAVTVRVFAACVSQ